MRRIGCPRLSRPGHRGFSTHSPIAADFTVKSNLSGATLAAIADNFRAIHQLEDLVSATALVRAPAFNSCRKLEPVNFVYAAGDLASAPSVEMVWFQEEPQNAPPVTFGSVR